MDDQAISSRRMPEVINNIFSLTFGKRHLSLRCFARSCLATLVLSIIALLLIRLLPNGAQGEQMAINATPGMVFPASLFILVSDYLSLWKTRFFLNRRTQTIWRLSLYLVLDILCSIVIAVLVFSIVLDAYYLILRHVTPPWSSDPDDIAADGLRLGIALINMTALFTALCTSIWMLLVIVSSSIVRALVPLHRVTIWFFNVEVHPIQTIGIVAGAIIIVASLVWSGIRALI